VIKHMTRLRDYSRLTLALVIAVLIVVPIGCVVRSRHHDRHSSTDSHASLTARRHTLTLAPSPSTEKRSPASALSADPKGNPIGTALQITVNNANSQDETADIAFPSSMADKIPGFAERYNTALADQQSDVSSSADSLDSILTDAIAGGAFSYRSSVLQLQVNDPSDRSITIYGIRPVVTTRTPIATAGVIGYAVGAGPTDRIDFDLDSPEPVGRRDVNGRTSSKPYFPYKTIDVSKGNPHNLDLKFSAEAASDVFHVLMDYDFNGKRFSQVVTDSHGVPLQMRVTGSPCDKPRGMSTAALQSFRNLHYGVVYESSVSSDGSMTTQLVNPQEFVAGGCKN
jgi:hypothetical protein